MRHKCTPTERAFDVLLFREEQTKPFQIAEDKGRGTPRDEALLLRRVGAVPQQSGSPNCQKHHTTPKLFMCQAVKEAYTPKSWTAVWERDISSSRKTISKEKHHCSWKRYIDGINTPSGLVASNKGSETDLTQCWRMLSFLTEFQLWKGGKEEAEET